MTKAKDKTFDRRAVEMRIEAAVDMIATGGPGRPVGSALHYRWFLIWFDGP